MMRKVSDCSSFRRCRFRVFVADVPIDIEPLPSGLALQEPAALLEDLLLKVFAPEPFLPRRLHHRRVLRPAFRV